MLDRSHDLVYVTLNDSFESEVIKAPHFDCVVYTTTVERLFILDADLNPVGTASVTRELAQRLHIVIHIIQLDLIIVPLIAASHDSTVGDDYAVDVVSLHGDFTLRTFVRYIRESMCIELRKIFFLGNKHSFIILSVNHERYWHVFSALLRALSSCWILSPLHF